MRVCLMPFDVSLIPSAVERYHRERDRYVKLADRVAEICGTDVCEQNAIRAQVTFRVKSSKSFEGKLRRFSTRGDRNYKSVDEIFAAIGDFAGVRIACYQFDDCTKIVEHLKTTFKGPEGEVAVDVKDKHVENRTNFYRATHVQVCLPTEEIVGIYDNVSDISCEIQVCSMISHVWNEIEHDIGYKPELGGSSEEEQTLLEMLGHTVRAGDAQITLLLKAHARRATGQQSEAQAVEDTRPFRDVHDFVSRMQDFEGRVMENFSDYSGQLYDLIVDLNLNTPARLISVLSPFNPDTLSTVAEEFGDWLDDEGVPELMPEADTSDLMLLKLFEVKLQQIDELHSQRSGRGRGRPTRLHRMLRRYQEYIEPDDED